MAEEKEPLKEAPAAAEPVAPLPAAWVAALGDGLIEGHLLGDDAFLAVRPEALLAACSYLCSAEGPGCTFFTCLTAVDRETPFELVYHLANIAANRRVELKTSIPRERPKLDSVTSLWSGANWYEREAFDLFGIEFAGHPALKRILMPDDWEGHPLRKDYVIPDHPLLREGPEHDLAKRRNSGARIQKSEDG
jgi:NADH-quinone oxidoreductase subunit C